MPIEIGFDEMINNLESECDFKYLVEGNANYEVMWMDESSYIPKKRNCQRLL